jgi:hypothetical protein
MAAADEKLAKALATPSYEELVYLTAFWALMDGGFLGQQGPLPMGHAKDLFELQKPANKPRSVFNDRRGLGLPAQRKVCFKQADRLMATPSSAFLAARAS